jgi:hypothetical protein
MNSDSDTICWTQIIGFGARIFCFISLAKPWQVGDTYRVVRLQPKEATTYSRDVKADALKDKVLTQQPPTTLDKYPKSIGTRLMLSILSFNQCLLSLNPTNAC